jgi:hypothetical protein
MRMTIDKWPEEPFYFDYLVAMVEHMDSSARISSKPGTIRRIIGHFFA